MKPSDGGNGHRWLIALLGLLLLGGSLLTSARIEREGYRAIWRNTDHTADMMSALLHDKTLGSHEMLGLMLQASLQKADIIGAVASGDRARINKAVLPIIEAGLGRINDLQVFSPEGRTLFQLDEVNPDGLEVMQLAAQKGGLATAIEAHGGQHVHAHVSGPVIQDERVVGYLGLTTSLEPAIARINDLLRLEMHQHAAHDKPGDVAMAMFPIAVRDAPEAHMEALDGSLPADALPLIRELIRNQRSQGETATHQFSIVTVEDDGGTPIALAVLSLDVTSALDSNLEHARTLMLVLLLGSALITGLAYVGLEHVVSRSRSQTRRLAEALDAAEAATRAKSEFLANMSHEIRTPMNAVIGLTTLCLKEPLEPKARDYIGKTRRAAGQLLGIINDILDLSKVEAGQLMLEEIPFGLDEITEGLVAMFDQQALDRGLAFRVDVAAEVPQTLLGDPLRLTQILNNLVGNALKFTEAGSVTLSISTHGSGEGRSLRFAVRDTGIGLTEAQLGRLFRPFAQADSSSTRRYGGTGLGLAISRQLVELMGGEIGAESTPGQGSCFSIDLPLKEPPAASPLRPASAASEGAAGAPRLTGRRILLVEDNDFNQIVAREFLAETDATVEIACNGQQAIDAVQAGHWDLILMDIQMPVMDGIAATRAIRQLQPSPRVPIIAMTAHALREERQRCLDAGMDDFITKPVNPEQLYRSLARWARSAGEATPPHAAEAAPPLAAEPPEATPAVDHLDTEAALRRARGDAQRLARWQSSFTLRFGETAAELRDKVRHNDAQEAGARAHNLKGTAGVVGAEGLAALAARAEQAAKGGHDDWPLLVEQLASALESVLARLAAPGLAAEVGDSGPPGD